MEYLNAFLCGGLLCAVGQIILDKTSLTPARILTGYVVAGVLLQAVGVYQYIVDWGGAGATLTGFGYSLAKGVAKAVAEDGLLGVLTGGLTATSGGIAAAVVFSLLAALLVRASSTGREEVVFSTEDREGAGKAAVARANELLAKEAAPELPLGDGVVANLLNKVAAGVSAFAQGTAMLAVSEETRDISGGFILKDGRIEVNCTFDALVRAEREQTAGEVAKLLFPEA